MSRIESPAELFARATKAAETKARNSRVVALASAGMNKTDIAKEVGLSRRSVGRILDRQNQQPTQPLST